MTANNLNGHRPHHRPRGGGPYQNGGNGDSIRVGEDRKKIKLPDGKTAKSSPPWEPSDQEIEVFSPVANAIYNSPIEIAGYAVPDGGTMRARLRTKDGGILAERTATRRGKDFTFFYTYLRFEVEKPEHVFLEITSNFASRGPDLDRQIVPIVIAPGQRTVDLNYPVVGAQLYNPLAVSGYSNTYEANVVVEVGQRDGKALFMQPASGGTYNVYDDFEVTLYPAVYAAQALLISVYAVSPLDGAHINQTRIPVTLLPQETPGMEMPKKKEEPQGRFGHALEETGESG